MKSIFLFSINNLRLENNYPLYQAIINSEKVIPLFIFDKDVFENNNINIYKKSLIYYSVKLLNDELKKYNSNLIIRYGKFLPELLKILQETKVNSMYLNSYNKTDNINFLLEEYNYKLFFYDDLESLKKIRKQKFYNYKNKFELNYKLNDCNYKISKLYNNENLFSENLESIKYKKFRDYNFNLSYDKPEEININNYEDLILHIETGLISPIKLLKETKYESNFIKNFIFNYIYFNEYKKLFKEEIDIKNNHYDNFSFFISLINSNTNNVLINAISKAILSKRVLSIYHLVIFINYALDKNVNQLWIKNFLKNELINFDDNLFNSILYNRVYDIKNAIESFKNIEFIKKYLNYNIPDYFFIYPYQIPVSMQKASNFIIGKDFPEYKLDEMLISINYD
ncbi:MAG: hypothetical protein KatS3mg068_1674 [Candidatus Sericytochromatia bacterium]|nr:MAG: hypothetical protein KatS3mg068_1674 [Candidatus Sericytochromatia bacterium]